MQLVELHRIDHHDPRFTAIDAAAFASKNLYNATLYQMRQQFIHEHSVIAYSDLDRLMQPTEQYRALPAKVAQWVLKRSALPGRVILPPVPPFSRIPAPSGAILNCRSISTSKGETF